MFRSVGQSVILKSGENHIELKILPSSLSYTTGDLKVTVNRPDGGPASNYEMFVIGFMDGFTRLFPKEGIIQSSPRTGHYRFLITDKPTRWNAVCYGAFDIHAGKTTELTVDLEWIR
jgi:hypothetical protein